jgi:hypothetical protein
VREASCHLTNRASLLKTNSIFGLIKDEGMVYSLSVEEIVEHNYSLDQYV